MSTKGVLVVISGFSGAGKGTVQIAVLSIGCPSFKI